MSRSDRRVVVTGAGTISPLGHDWASVHLRLRECRNAVRHMEDWDKYEGLNTRLAAPAEPFDLPAHYNRKTTRSMGRVALMSVRATELALAQACVYLATAPKSNGVYTAYKAAMRAAKEHGSLLLLWHGRSIGKISLQTRICLPVQNSVQVLDV